MFVFDHALQKLEKVEYLKDGDILPKERNSHSFVQNGKTAYIFGGANNEGPLNDAFELDLESMKFKRIAITTPDTPFFEMHSSHLYQGNKMLLIGGRSHVLLSQQNDPNALQAAMMRPFRDVIISLDLSSGQVEEFASLPTSLAAHTSFLIDDKYLVIYGGTNGLKFFDSVIRYDIAAKKWTLMTKQPESQKGSPFFKDGRFACVSAATPSE